MIEFWWFGKSKIAEYDTITNQYLNKINHYHPVKKVVFRDITNVRDSRNLKIEEGALILSKLNAKDYVVLLDEHGKQFSSTNFSTHIQKVLEINRRVIIIIGGAYGFSDEVKYLAKEIWSFSSMTFPHDMVRILISEQIYRAFTIINRQKYHHE